MTLSLSKLIASDAPLTDDERKRLLAIAKAALVAQERAEDVFLDASSENIAAFSDADKALRASLEGVEL